MYEAFLAKPLIRKRAGQRGRARRDHFRDFHSNAFDVAHETQQTVITGVRRCGSLGLSDSAVLAVVVMEAAKLQAGVSYCPHKLKNFVPMTLLNSGAIHAGVDVE